jgi:Flp pilus assembly pilin Flp
MKRNNLAALSAFPVDFHTNPAACREYPLDASTVTALQFVWMRLWKNDDGGDVSEYTLLVTFLLLVSACLFLSSASNVSSVWQAANSFMSRGSASGQSQSITTEVP